MRRKKNSALGVKWLKGDDITDMEGAMHGFITPVISRWEMNGDYRYNLVFGGNGIDRFGDTLQSSRTDVSKRKYQLARFVVLSASVQMDFEDARVMLSACRLEGSETIGHDLSSDTAWVTLDSKAKQDDKQRRAYDELLRQHIIYHLTEARRLPARESVKDLMDINEKSSFWSYSSQHQSTTQTKLWASSPVWTMGKLSPSKSFSMRLYNKRRMSKQLSKLYVLKAMFIPTTLLLYSLVKLVPRSSTD